MIFFFPFPFIALFFPLTSFSATTLHFADIGVLFRLCPPELTMSCETLTTRSASLRSAVQLCVLGACSIGLHSGFPATEMVLFARPCREETFKPFLNPEQVSVSFFPSLPSISTGSTPPPPMDAHTFFVVLFRPGSTRTGDAWVTS